MRTICEADAASGALSKRVNRPTIVASKSPPSSGEVVVKVIRTS